MQRTKIWSRNKDARCLMCQTTFAKGDVVWRTDGWKRRNRKYRCDKCQKKLNDLYP